MHRIRMRADNDDLREMPIFRKATENDVPAVAAILRKAVERMLAEGKKQWDYNYPNETHIRADIERGIGYVLDYNNEILGYGAMIFEREPAYDSIDGKWLSDERYVVVHRMAIKSISQRKGLGHTFLKDVENYARSKGIRSFRVDTNFDNIRMLNLLKKSGFTYCGEIQYESGSRKAFEKLLTDLPT